MMNKNTAIIAVTEKGIKLGQIIFNEIAGDFFIPEKFANKFDENYSYYEKLQDCYKYLFENYKNIIAVMAQGIVTRMIVPFVESKYTDPAVVTCDEVGRYAISTLSGHEGGANLLAHLVSSIMGAVPVITTATEANRLYVAGVGCRKNTSSKEIEDAILKACETVNIGLDDIRLLSSAWVKKEEKGLIEAANNLNLYLRFLPKSYYLNSFYNFKEQNAPMKYFGIPGVAEPSAVIAALNPEIVLERTVFGNVTVAIVKENLINKR